MLHRSHMAPLTLERIAGALRDRQSRISGKSVSFRCLVPTHEDRRPSCLAWTDESGLLRVWCYVCGSPDALWQAVASRLGIRAGGHRHVAPAPAMREREGGRAAVAGRIWNRSVAVPDTDRHPARLWLSRRSLWRPEAPVPGMIRWLPGRPGHDGAGSLACLLAFPGAWRDAWPQLPDPAAIQTIAVGWDGQPALDRAEDEGGLDKRTIGTARGAVMVIGKPALPGDVRVAEGVADALAIASRYCSTVVAVAGTAGMGNHDVAKWLGSAGGQVVIHADTDVGKLGRAPAGTGAAGRLREAVRGFGGDVRAVYPPSGYKDAADAASALGFGPLPDGWVDGMETLLETTDWPRWEIARIAQITVMQQ